MVTKRALLPSSMSQSDIHLQHSPSKLPMTAQSYSRLPLSQITSHSYLGYTTKLAPNTHSHKYRSETISRARTVRTAAILLGALSPVVYRIVSISISIEAAVHAYAMLKCYLYQEEGKGGCCVVGLRSRRRLMRCRMQIFRKCLFWLFARVRL
jgi:hypothetical protein